MRLLIFTAFFILSLNYGHTEQQYFSLKSEKLPIDDNADLNKTVLFYLYTRSAKKSRTQVQIGDWSTIIKAGFKVSKKTVFISHGWHGNCTSNTTQFIKDQLLRFHDVNAIAVDWSYYSSGLYIRAVPCVEKVGRFVGAMASYLISNGQPQSKLHLVGHSLGAHLSGFAGKQLKDLGHIAGRITGLDPAAPLFSGAGTTQRLASSDGLFVDCIHTAIDLLGISEPICQADFYPNGGMHQPGCTPDDDKDCSCSQNPEDAILSFGQCSHHRAVDLFASSLNAKNKFYTKKCEKISHATPINCTRSDAQMGYFASPKYHGEFYLKTTDKFPYALNNSTNFVPTTNP